MGTGDRSRVRGVGLTVTILLAALPWDVGAHDAPIPTAQPTTPRWQAPFQPRPGIGTVDPTKWHGDWERVPPILLPRGPFDAKFDRSIREAIAGEEVFQEVVRPRVRDANGEYTRKLDREIEVFNGLGRLAWPGVGSLPRIDVPLSPRWSDRRSLGWLVASTPESLVVLTDDLQLTTVQRSLDWRVRVVDYEDEVEQRLQWFVANRNGRPNQLRRRPPFSDERAPATTSEAAWFHAMFCRSRGMADASAEFARWAVRDGNPVHTGIQRAREWRTYQRGALAWTHHGDRQLAREYWNRLATRFPESPLTKNAATLCERLDRESGSSPRTLPPRDLAERSEREQAAFWADRLDWVAARQFLHPGRCNVRNAPPDDVAHQLIRLGKPAVPLLIERLDDERLTRSYGGRGFGSILQCRDVAVQILEAIALEQFHQADATGQYLSNDTPERRAEAIARVNAWWGRNKDRTEADWLRESLARDGIRNLSTRIDAAHRLIALEGRGAVDFFRARLVAEPDQPHVLGLLWKAGGKEVIRDVLPYVESENDSMRSEAYRILVAAEHPGIVDRIVAEYLDVAMDPEPDERHGQTLPYRLLESGQPKARRVVCRVLREGNVRASYDALRALSWKKEAWAVPFIAERLTDERVIPPGTFRLCDEAALVLIGRYDLPGKIKSSDTVAARDAMITDVRRWWNDDRPTDVD